MRRLELTIESSTATFVRGHGAFDLLKRATGRTPVYATISRAFSTSTSRVPDLVAAGERAGFEMVVIDERSTIHHALATPITRQTPEPAEQEPRLW